MRQPAILCPLGIMPCKKHKTPGRGAARFPYEHLYQKLGLKRLSLTTRDLPWAKARCPVRAPDAANPHVRCDERRLETELRHVD